jgi:hypothetical protein
MITTDVQVLPGNTIHLSRIDHKEHTWDHLQRPQLAGENLLMAKLFPNFWEDPHGDQNVFGCPNCDSLMLVSL